MIIKDLILKNYSDVPFVDNLVYYTKILALGAVVKNQEEADKNESRRSLYLGDLYCKCIEDRATYDMFKYTHAMLKQIGVPDYLIERCIVSPSAIPEYLRKNALSIAKRHFLFNYNEENAYYRKILGKPPIGSRPLFVDDDLRIDNIGIDYSKSLDEMKMYELENLNDYGIYKEILKRYNSEEYDYLNYLGNNISLYAARKATEYELLYIPAIEFQTISEKFKDRFIVNREFTIQSVKSEAYEFQSEFYNKFIIIFILIQTMIDLISEVQEHIIKREAFDERCVRYIFEANGVPYFDEIPFRYQCNMLRSLNTLLKYKSTAKCMVEICSLFGFSSFNIFKYYLLKDRAVDPITNDYLFNYNVKYYDNAPNPVSIKIQKINITEKEIANNHFKIDYPFNDYEDLGNLFHVIVDGKLVDPSKYTTVDGFLSFQDTSILKPNSVLEIKFIYNEKSNFASKDFDKYIINQKIQQFAFIKDVFEYKINIPQKATEFYEDHNEAIVSVGSVFLNSQLYKIDPKNNTITFDKTNTSDILSDGRIVTIVFIYNNNKDNQFLYYKKHAEVSEETGSVKVPEPFENYLNSNHNFFVTENGTFLDNKRYFIENNNYLSFIDHKDQINKDKNIEFNFLYSNSKNIEFEEKIQTISIKENVFQYDLEPPFKNYLEKNFIIEVKYDENVLRPSQFVILKEKITLTDPSILFNPNHALKIRFFYPKDLNNTMVKVNYVDIKMNSLHSIYLPDDFNEFLSTGNIVRIMHNGKLLDSGSYSIHNNKVEYKNPDDVFNMSDIVVCYMFYNDNNTYNIAIDQVYCLPTKDKNVFKFNYPFFGYLQSGNSLIVLLGSLIVTSDRYKIKKNYIIFDEDIDLKNEREVTILFFYNTIFSKFNNYIVDSEVLVDIEDELYAKLKLPTVDYLTTKNNSFIVTFEDGTIVSPDEYEIYEGYMYFFKPWSEISKHGTKVRFIFNYIHNIFKRVYEEDLEKDFKLKFVKAPIEEDEDKYVKDVNNHIPYDSFVQDDKLWDTEEIPHERLKQLILKKEFSYVYSKYISIDTVMSFSKLTFDLPYFFGMLFDEVKLEERLRLQVPILQTNKMFRLSDLLCYLFSITFSYYDLKDDIMQDPKKIMYMKGFNFKADLDLIKKKIINLGINPAKIGVDDFIIYNTRLNYAKDFLNIFNQNIAVRKRLLKGMFNANNKREYDAFKIAYESLMQVNYNTKFFKISTGEENASDKSYSEYLKYRDDSLYKNILYINNIKDKNERNKYISEQIISICGYIDMYFDSKDYEYLWSKFPGVGIDFIRNYVKKVINFFKSYKVSISSINTLYKFDNKFEQTARAIDGIKYFSLLKYDDFVQCIDGFGAELSYFTKKDICNIIDTIYLFRYWFKNINLIDNGDDIKEVINLICKLLFKEKVLKNITEKLVYISKFKLNDNMDINIFDGFGEFYSYNNKKEYINLIDKVYIKRYKKHIDN